MDIMLKLGKTCIINSIFLNEKDEIPAFLGAYYRNSTFCITREHIKFDIQISAKSNHKMILIVSNREAAFGKFYEIAMNLVRFENLLEGMFYKVTEWNFDDIELLPEIGNCLLSYMNSHKTFGRFYNCYNDESYKKLYLSFEKYLKKRILQYHSFLYASYLDGMTADLRMALLLEVFEPLADELHNVGKISLHASPYYTVENRCNQCGARISRRLPNNKVHLNDRITAVIKKYGKDIYRGDSVAKIVKKAVALRNKIDHVNNRRGAFTGPECGHYVFKFSLLYRIIVMQEIGIPYENFKDKVVALIGDFNKRFPDQRLLP